MSDDLLQRVARVICCPPHLGHCCPEECSAHYFLPTARAAIAVALDEAARVCEQRFMGDHNREDMEARRCAAAIRAMIPQEPA